MMERYGFEVILLEENHIHIKIPTGYSRKVFKKTFGYPVGLNLNIDLLKDIDSWEIVEEEIQEPEAYNDSRQRGKEKYNTIFRRCLWFEKEEDAILYKMSMDS